MPKCWTCGAHVQYPVFTCPACKTVKQLQTLRGEVSGKLDNLVNIQQRGFEILSEKLSDIASILEWGFDELIWQIEQQTMVLKSIDETLKTPSQTQAKEWRQIAEELRNRGVYDESEKFFIKSVEANPLDYRTYIGLAQTYLYKEQFDKAKIFLEKSLSHAPLVVNSEFGHNKPSSKVKMMSSEEAEIRQNRYYRDTVLEQGFWELGHKLDFKMNDVYDYMNSLDNLEKLSNRFDDYKSYSYRLLGHIYACEENYHKAVACLKSAITLSPQYADGYYDYAQYCAQTGNKNECLTSLSKAIAGKSLYFYLSQKEKNFDSIRTDVENLITEINNEALQRVETEYRNAEKILNEVGNDIYEVEKKLQVYKLKKHELLVYQPNLALGSLEAAKDYYNETLLALENIKDKLASKDYSSILEALPIAQKTIKNIKNIKNIMRNIKKITQEFEERQSKFRKKNIGCAVSIVIAIIFIVFLVKRC